MATANGEADLEKPIDGVDAEVDGEREHRAHARVPWIGALPNPRIGPMLVINDEGNFVPLCTSGDLLRGCRYFWRVGRE